jgi:hypothetical protein
MNICDCGANFGDFCLFREPGRAFFPFDKKEASQITIGQLAVTGIFEFDAEFDCSYGEGLGDLIFALAKKQEPR